MLNRLFIIIGILAIVLIAAAFIVPHLVPWGSYRDRMETLAAEVLGTDVRINGDIGFTLLPQPHLRFTDVTVGPVDAPAFTVAAVSADFSLLDFLRDRYAVTRLVLDRPILDLTVDASGQFTTGLNLAAEVSGSNVSVANATIANGTVSLFDVRSNSRVEASDIDGTLELRALRGPFSFSGTGFADGRRYDGRLTLQALDANGATQASLFVRPEMGGSSLSAEGTLTTGAAPHFAGNLTYRQSAPPAEGADGVQGDLVLTSTLDASSERMQLGAFILQPDENRAGTRLQGQAIVHFGAEPRFDATVTGGVVALPARDARADQSAEPYELVRLLRELPDVPGAPLDGSARVEMAELNLRAFALRNVAFTLRGVGGNWEIEDFSARLPGDSRAELTGNLSSNAGRPAFSGRVAVTTERLDALAALWRKPEGDNPLFNLPAGLDTQVTLAGDRLSLAEGTFTLDGQPHVVSAEMNFGDSRSLEFRGAFKALNAADSAALVALMPDVSASGFGLSFPQGRFSLAAESAGLFGLDGKGLAADGSWSPNGISFGHLAADDLGGAGFDLAAEVNGTLAEPRLAGRGLVRVKAENAPVLGMLERQGFLPERWRAFVGGSMPAQLNLDLGVPDAAGQQVLVADGSAGHASLSVSARFGAGVMQAVTGPLALQATVVADDAEALTEQFGLGAVPLFSPGAPVKLTLNAEGTLAGSLDTRLRAEGNADFVSYQGTLVLGDLSTPQGRGRLAVQLSDGSGLGGLIDADGLSLPGLSGSSSINFVGGGTMSLAEIRGESGGQNFSGNLIMTREGGRQALSGALNLPALDIAGLAGALGGQSSVVHIIDGVWPDGPFDIGDTARMTGGRINIKTPALTNDGRPRLSDVQFDLSWDETNVRLRNLTGALGGGRLQLDMGICCSGPAPQKRVTGRASLEAVALDALLPPASAGNVAATMTGSIQFDGTGDSLAAAMAAMTGEGSFGLTDLVVQKLDPAAFTTVANLDNIVEIAPDDLTNLVAMALDRGSFSAPDMSGVFTIAGGTLRVQNLAAQSDVARLFGGGALDLEQLGLNGSFTLSPLPGSIAGGLIDEGTSLVTAIVDGTLSAPERELDLGTMVDAIQVRAFELEVDRLERQRAEDEARARAAAEERARMMEEQARRQAEEAQRAAEAEQRRQEEDARRRAAEQAARAASQQPAAPTSPPPTAPAQPFDLQLPPAAGTVPAPANPATPFPMPAN